MPRMRILNAADRVHLALPRGPESVERSNTSTSLNSS